MAKFEEFVCNDTADHSGAQDCDVHLEKD